MLDDLFQFVCGYEFVEVEMYELVKIEISGGLEKLFILVEIYFYNMVFICIGEYVQQKGGIIESVLEFFVMVMNIVNVIFECEVGVCVQLIEDQELLVYFNVSIDFFINVDNGGGFLGQVQGVFIGVGVFMIVYDMGYVFMSGCIDVGGVVGGQVCIFGKDCGVICYYINNIIVIICCVFMYEVVYQFVVVYFWSNCFGNDGQLVSGLVYELGLGMMIMFYVGSCGMQNIVFNNDDYYYGYFFEQFIFFMCEGQVSNCVIVLFIDNMEFKLIFDYEDGFYIFVNIFFELVVVVEDVDEDVIMYCWEQLDLGLIFEIGDFSGIVFLFCSYLFIINFKCVFLCLEMIVNNEILIVEVLFVYICDFIFCCIVRDNNFEIGVIFWEDMVFRSMGGVGFFLVMLFNIGEESWCVGEFCEVIWDVVNMDNDLVNCQLVNICLLMDGGYIYFYILIEEMFNIGFVFVMVLDVMGSQMCIWVEVVDNIFFDILNNNFSIDQVEVLIYIVEYGLIFQ